MSRVDEDREAARQAERIALQKREQELKARERQQSDSAFSRLVQQTKAEKTDIEERGKAQSVIAHLLEKKEGAAAKELTRAFEAQGRGQAQESEVAQARDQLRGRQAGRDERVQRGEAAESERSSTAHAASEATDGLLEAGHSADQLSAEAGAEGRALDARSGRETLEERRQSSDQAAAGRSTGRASAEKGDLKADADSGGQGQGGQDQKPDGRDAGAAAFRLNPALMAPVPLAKPREGPTSDRLRQLANEIAQRIVERVRIGTNASGKAEFQIDLRSNVLSGLSIKVSGSSGRIRAVFSGSDREVLQLLKQQADSLKKALTGRGLTLEELSIEERR